MFLSQALVNRYFFFTYFTTPTTSTRAIHTFTKFHLIILLEHITGMNNHFLDSTHYSSGLKLVQHERRVNQTTQIRAFLSICNQLAIWLQYCTRAQMSWSRVDWSVSWDWLRIVSKSAGARASLRSDRFDAAKRCVLASPDDLSSLYTHTGARAACVCVACALRGGQHRADSRIQNNVTHALGSAPSVCFACGRTRAIDVMGNQCKCIFQLRVCLTCEYDIWIEVCACVRNGRKILLLMHKFTKNKCRFSEDLIYVWTCV